MSDEPGGAPAPTPYTVINFQRAVNAAVAAGSLTSTQSLILCVMSVEWGSWEDGSNIRCSQSKIAAMTGYSRQTVSRTMGQLEELGCIRQTGWSKGCKVIDLVHQRVVALCYIVAERDNVTYDDNDSLGDTSCNIERQRVVALCDTNRTLEQNPNREETERSPEESRELAHELTETTTTPDGNDSGTIHNPYLDDAPPLDVYLMETVETYRGEQPSIAVAQGVSGHVLNIARQSLQTAGADASRLGELARGWVSYKLLDRSDYAEARGISAGQMARLVVRDPREQADWSANYLAGATVDHMAQHLRDAAALTLESIGDALEARASTTAETYEEINW